jgi:8-oxo-dGTP pyrophosphatase MutT (NUDIX family)
MKVVAGIAQKECKLLMFYSQKHSKWEFPGGKVEQGETDVDALKREWKEELDCEIIVDQYFDCYYNETDGFEINYYLITPITEWVFKEHSEAKYFTPDEAMLLDIWASDWLMVGEFYE